MPDPQTRAHVRAVINYLKDTLTHGGRKLADRQLAEQLNELRDAPDRTPGFSTTRIVQIREEKARLRPTELDAIRSLVLKRIPGFTWQHLPDEIQPYIITQSAAALIQEEPSDGETLGDTAEFLSGAWQMYYVSPVDREGRFNKQIRGMAVFAWPDPVNKRRMRMFVASSNTIWKGYCFINGAHLYAIWHEVDRTSETAFVITNKPLKDHDYICGMMIALHRKTQRRTQWSIRPAAACLCFGQKWREGDTNATPDQLKQAMSSVFREDELSNEILKEMRDHFCETFTFKEFQNQRQDLANYVKNQKINNIRRWNWDATTFHLSWE